MSIEEEKKNINEFLETVRHRLHDRAERGYIGWDCGPNGLDDGKGRSPSTASTIDLQNRLENAIEEERYIDAAALSMFLWNRQVQYVEELKTVENKI